MVFLAVEASSLSEEIRIIIGAAMAAEVVPGSTVRVETAGPADVVAVRKSEWAEPAPLFSRRRIRASQGVRGLDAAQAAVAAAAVVIRIRTATPD
ncbi:hypothetical protein [Sphingomonas sp. 1P08PE]|uniref:hypothetical protein n=1 Tax=Sphingomonas sp. 1P08PE TaxID=554122 RepID=UPI0039A3EA11